MGLAAEVARRGLLQGAAAALLSGCGDGAALDRLAQGPRAKAVRALSGDKLELEGGRKLLLAGIQAPAPGAPYGDAARTALDQLVRGRSVELLYGQSGGEAEGEAATRPAHVRLSPGRTWVQGALLGAGAAWVRTAADDRALAREMLTREAAARAGRKGLWALPVYGVRLADEVEPGEHGFRIVEGRVARAGRGRAGFYLDLSADWRGAVSLRIPSAALRDFRSAGLDPLGLQGRLIRARGPLSWSYGAPVLAVDHPEAVELLASRGRVPPKP